MLHRHKVHEVSPRRSEVAVVHRDLRRRRTLHVPRCEDVARREVVSLPLPTAELTVFPLPSRLSRCGGRPAHLIVKLRHKLSDVDIDGDELRDAKLFHLTNRRLLVVPKRSEQRRLRGGDVEINRDARLLRPPLTHVPLRAVREVAGQVGVINRVEPRRVARELGDDPLRGVRQLREGGVVRSRVERAMLLRAGDEDDLLVNRTPRHSAAEAVLLCGISDAHVPPHRCRLGALRVDAAQQHRRVVHDVSDCGAGIALEQLRVVALAALGELGDGVAQRTLPRLDVGAHIAPKLNVPMLLRVERARKLGSRRPRNAAQPAACCGAQRFLLLRRPALAAAGRRRRGGALLDNHRRVHFANLRRIADRNHPPRLEGWELGEKVEELKVASAVNVDAAERKVACVNAGREGVRREKKDEGERGAMPCLSNRRALCRDVRGAQISETWLPSRFIIRPWCSTSSDLATHAATSPSADSADMPRSGTFARAGAASELTAVSLLPAMVLTSRASMRGAAA